MGFVLLVTLVVLILLWYTTGMISEDLNSARLAAGVANQSGCVTDEGWANVLSALITHTDM